MAVLAQVDVKHMHVYAYDMASTVPPATLLDSEDPKGCRAIRQSWKSMRTTLLRASACCVRHSVTSTNPPVAWHPPGISHGHLEATAAWGTVSVVEGQGCASLQ